MHTHQSIVALLISIRDCGDVSVVDLFGRSTVDTGESDLLSEDLRKLLDVGKRKLLLNLMNLSQIDSSGVSIIVEVFVSLKRAGGVLKLLAPRGRGAERAEGIPLARYCSYLRG